MRSRLQQIKRYSLKKNQRSAFCRNCSSSTATKPKSSSVLKVVAVTVVAGAIVFVWSQKERDEAPVETHGGLNYLADVMTTPNLDISPWQIPHDDKRYKGGEDTYFISSSGNQFGVFDGVGGWAKKGVDPRDYSLSLSKGCRQGVDGEGLTDPLQILTYGYDKSKGIKGSSTAVVVSIDGSKLSGINVGDSAYIVLRDDKILYQSPMQQHKFNFPYQLGSNDINVPEDGDVNSLNLKDKDIIVLVTDGVLDNMSEKEIVDVVRRSSTLRPAGIAKRICQSAYKGSKAEKGKPDDITSIVVKCNFKEEKTRA
jgi:protein phosphatase PTC7